MITMKSKSEKRFSVSGHDFQRTVSEMIPCIGQLVKKRQLNSAH